jgi:hypothetical protein
VAESEASGDSDYTGDYRLDDPADTDRLSIQVPEAWEEEAAEPEPGTPDDGFDYLLNPAQDGADGAPVDEIVWEDAQPVVPENHFLGPDEDRFDAFDANTWHFKAPPTPWYRTQLALIALVAVAVAVVALVVSVVLLVFDGQSDGDETPSPATSSTPTTATTAPQTTSALPPPPPPETSAPPTEPPPVYNGPRSEPRRTKEPEIGVTRTPVTRSPISVAPRQRQGSQR